MSEKEQDRDNARLMRLMDSSQDFRVQFVTDAYRYVLRPVWSSSASIHAIASSHDAFLPAFRAVVEQRPDLWAKALKDYRQEELVIKQAKQNRKETNDA